MRINKNKRNNLELSLVEKTNVKSDTPDLEKSGVFLWVIVGVRVHQVGE